MEKTLERNLARTFERIDLCFKLKEACYVKQYPQATPEKIRELIYQDILSRKEKQWTLPKTSLKQGNSAPISPFLKSED